MALDGDFPPEVREQLRTADQYTVQVAHWRLLWRQHARAKQITPRGNWNTWLILAGRGFGKTRTGAEDIGQFAVRYPGVRCGVVAPTQNDCRSICFEGESGLLRRIPPYFVRGYNSTDLEIELINGSMIIGKSAEKPDRLRGPNWHRAWGDELASWGAALAGMNRKKDAKRLIETYDNLMLGLRLGTHPQLVLTTTPRPLDFLRAMIKDPTCVVTKGNTFENTALAPTALETFRRIFDGTRKGQQELHAEILDSNENALWKPDQLEQCRVREVPAGVTFLCVVVAIDPAVTSDEEESDETGIVCAALGDDGLIYVLHDISGIYTPRQWARLALTTYERESADAIVGETNQGGDLVEANLRGEADGALFNYKGVHAKRGKYLRAEPIAAYYEKGKVRHVGHFPKLEKQMCDFVGSTADGSPDRLDALVYAVGELMTRTVRHAFW